MEEVPITKITIEISGVKRDVIVPSSWNDLSLRSLLLFYETMFTTPGDEFTQSAFTMVKLLSMAQYMLKLDNAALATWEADCIRNAAADPDALVSGEDAFLDELHQVLHATIGGLFIIEKTESGATTYALKYNRTVTPYPSLHYTPKVAKGTRKMGKTQVLYAPGDGLGNITIYELGYTFTLFETYLETQDESFADTLMAVLYRPSRPLTKKEKDSNWQGDRRMPLRGYEAKIIERSKMMKTLDPMCRRVIMFWFTSCRHAIVSAHPKVFKASLSDNQKEIGYGWGGVLLSIAGGPAHLNEVADQHYSNALTWLSMKADENQ